MLVVFPLGLLATGVVFDIVYFASRTSRFAEVAYWLILSGIIGGLLAAPLGLLDWLGIPSGTRAKRIGALHGLGNAVVLVLFVVSEIMRNPAPADAPVTAYVCSFAGASLALVTAWLGGELVDRLGIGVYPDAGVDAPSSLRRTAHGRSAAPPDELARAGAGQTSQILSRGLQILVATRVGPGG